MKKLITCTLLAFAASSFAAVPSYAGCCFGLCKHHCGCCGCGAKFCVRQYNAFSPVCCGTVFCDGCCPFGSCGYGNGGFGPGFGGACGPCAGGVCPGMLNYSGIMSCPPGVCADGACLGSLPAAEPCGPMSPSTTTPAGSNPVVTPSPLPTQTEASPTSHVIINDRGIQNTNFRPVSYPVPAVNIMPRMQPQTMAAPSYWGN
jgi:hypothetical protein